MGCEAIRGLIFEWLEDPDNPPLTGGEMANAVYARDISGEIVDEKLRNPYRPNYAPWSSIAQTSFGDCCCAFEIRKYFLMQLKA